MAGSVVVPDLEMMLMEKSLSPMISRIIEGVGQELDGCPGSQIGTADAYHHQDLGIVPDLLRRLLDAGELVLIILHRKVYPAQKVTACSGTLYQSLLCQLRSTFQD